MTKPLFSFLMKISPLVEDVIARILVKNRVHLGQRHKSRRLEDTRCNNVEPIKILELRLRHWTDVTTRPCLPFICCSLFCRKNDSVSIHIVVSHSCIDACTHVHNARQLYTGLHNYTQACTGVHSIAQCYTQLYTAYTMLHSCQTTL